MDKQYYVRFKGRVIGPMSSAKICNLVQAGNITSSQEVSVDRTTWRKSEEFAELHQGKGRPDVTSSQVASHASSTGDGNKQWYLQADGQTQGPFEESRLLQLVNSGSIKRATLVWCEGLPSWATAAVTWPAWFEAADESTPNARMSLESTSDGPRTDNMNFDLDEPTEFGRYRLLKQLGVGGMGTVYLAHDTQLDRQVALKLPHTGSTSSTLSERFRREARMSAILDHPNICRIFDIGEHEGRLFLTMAFIEGSSLHDIIQARGPIDSRTAATLMCGIAKAVHLAHSHDIIHRDLKPANIMIQSNGNFVIMDFGLARRIEQTDQQITATGAVIGTPAYMAPEQLRGDANAIGPQSDVYSLGVIFYELLVGQRPFRGTLPQIYSQVLAAKSVRPVNDDLDARLCDICERATASNVSERFETAAELSSDLENYLSSGGGSENANESLSQLAAIASPATEILTKDTVSKSSSQRQKRRFAKFPRPVIFVMIFAASLLVLVVMYFVARPARENTEDVDRVPNRDASSEDTSSTQAKISLISHVIKEYEPECFEGSS